MKLAFATAALASGLAGAGLAALLVWLVTVVTSSSGPWTVAPAVVTAVAAIVAGATYLAERVVYRRSLERRRSIGEPWAFRDD